MGESRMHILVATDGFLDPVAATAFVERLREPGDSVTVLTVIHHPGEFLRSFAESPGGSDLDKVLGAAGPSSAGFSSGSITAERLEQVSHSKRGHAQPLDAYFADTAKRHQKSLLEEFAKSSIEARAVWSPTENKTARTILDAATREDADVLVIGSHGGGRFEGLLGSTVTKVVRLAELPVLLVR